MKVEDASDQKTSHYKFTDIDCVMLGHDCIC